MLQTNTAVTWGSIAAAQFFTLHRHTRSHRTPAGRRHSLWNEELIRVCQWVFNLTIPRLWGALPWFWLCRSSSIPPSASIIEILLSSAFSVNQKRDVSLPQQSVHVTALTSGWDSGRFSLSPSFFPPSFTTHLSFAGQMEPSQGQRALLCDLASAGREMKPCPHSAVKQRTKSCFDNKTDMWRCGKTCRSHRTANFVHFISPTCCSLESDTSEPKVKMATSGVSSHPLLAL